jgi:4-amino-4-deoxy-L-arabinose transferase-like glycosyltransferase
MRARAEQASQSMGGATRAIQPGWVLAALLAIQIGLGLLYASVTPIFEASDEIWHYAMVREIVANRRLPVQNPAIDAPWAQEGSQPPLYYALGALLTGWIDPADAADLAERNPFAKAGIPLATDNKNLAAHPSDQSPLSGGVTGAVFLIRLFSVLLGTATAYLTYRLAATLYPRTPAIGLLAAAFVAFNPMVLFIGASVNNDTLLMLLSTAALGLMVRDVQSDQPGLRGRQTLLLGALLGLACLTKVSGALLLPVAALAVTFSAWRARSWQTWLARGVLLLLAVAAIAGWWYLRNLRLYGELTGITTMAAIAGARPAGFGLADLPGEWRSFWYSFWGLFGAFNVLAPAWFYALTSGLALLAGAGLLLRAAACLRGRRLPAHWQSHTLLALFIALTFIGIVRWTLITMASQGRLMFGAVAAIALYLALGWLAWFPPRWQRWAGAGNAAALAGAAAILALTAIAPSYRPPQPLAAQPPDAVALNITCADDITLLGYRLGQETIQPGQPLDITLYWTAQQPPADNLQLSVNVYGFGGESVAKLDTWPGGGLLPTRFWQPGAIYPDRYLLPTAPQASAPTRLRAGIEWNSDLLNPAANRSLSCVVNGQPMDALFLDAGALAAAPADAAELPPALSTLQHGIQLLDAQISPAGDRVNVELSWAATQPIPGDYTVFLHLFDAAGVRLAQDDGPPRAGYWPTSAWRPGDLITSTHSLALPAGLPAGSYRLGTGLYDPATGQRLFAYGPDGSEWRDWMVLLPPVELDPPE